jgi:hypothetical protein
MGEWGAEAVRWFTLAEQQVGAALKLIGQDNEMITLGVVILIGLVTLSLVWALVLGFLRVIVGIFGGGSKDRPEGDDPRREGFVLAASPTRERGRLDVVPSAAPRLRPADPAPKMREPGQSEPSRPEPSRTEPSRPEPSRPEIGAPRDGGASRPRLSEAAGATARGALPISPTDDLHQIQLRQLPQLAHRGRVVSARPEWTGKVVPSSLQAAGAVEVCKVLSRRAPALAGNETVRAVDYRVCGLPRVDGEGRRQPDVMVYTVTDRGFLPKGASAKQSRR